jgi:ankyrin repeat protein
MSNSNRSGALAMALALACSTLVAEDLSTLKAAQKLVKAKTNLELPRKIQSMRLASVMRAGLAENIGIWNYDAELKSKSANAFKSKDYLLEATPLVEAILFGNLEGAEFLVKSGAKLDAARTIYIRKDKSQYPEHALESPYYRYTPLMAACLTGDLRMADMLLRAGADPSFRLDPYHRSALELAVDSGASLDLLRRLVEAGADKASLDQALIVASFDERADAVAYLLGAGADPNAFSPSEADYYQTPLLCATLRMNAGIARILLEGGADPNLANKERPALGPELARLGYYYDDAFAANHYECTNIGIANVGGSVAKLRAAPADPEGVVTPIRAAFKGLYRGGFDRAGANAYNLDLIERSSALVDALLSASPRLNGYGGLDSPLMLAAQGGSLDLVERMLAMGAEPDYANSRGETALEYLAKGTGGLTGSEAAFALRLKEISYPIVDLLLGNRSTKEDRLAHFDTHVKSIQAMMRRGSYPGGAYIIDYLIRLATAI